MCLASVWGLGFSMELGFVWYLEIRVSAHGQRPSQTPDVMAHKERKEGFWSPEKEKRERWGWLEEITWVVTVQFPAWLDDWCGSRGDEDCREAKGTKTSVRPEEGQSERGDGGMGQRRGAHRFWGVSHCSRFELERGKEFGHEWAGGMNLGTNGRGRIFLGKILQRHRTDSYW
jgi:hypothetical protein